MQEIGLSNQRPAMAMLDEARRAKSVSMAGLMNYSKIATNSFRAWLDGTRSPSLSSFIRLADSFDFEVVMISAAGAEYDLNDQAGAMEVIELERRARGMSFGEMDTKSGISTTAFFAWRSCERSPLLCNAVAIAETFGFRLVMRTRRDFTAAHENLGSTGTQPVQMETTSWQ